MEPPGLSPAVFCLINGPLRVAAKRDLLYSQPKSHNPKLFTTMRFDKFTIKSQEAVQRAQELAQEAGNPQIDALHLLAALVQENEGIVRPLLDKIGVNRGQLESTIEAELKHFPRSTSGNVPQPSPGLMQVFDTAQKQAGTMKDDFVSTEHLLLALGKVDTKAKKILDLNALTEKDLLKGLQAIRGNTRVTDQARRQIPSPGKIRHRPG